MSDTCWPYLYLSSNALTRIGIRRRRRGREVKEEKELHTFNLICCVVNKEPQSRATGYLMMMNRWWWLLLLRHAAPSYLTTTYCHMLNEGYFNSMFNKNSFIKYERTVFDIGHEGGRVGQCQVTPLSVCLLVQSILSWLATVAAGNRQLRNQVDNARWRWVLIGLITVITQGTRRCAIRQTSEKGVGMWLARGGLTEKKKDSHALVHSH